MLIVIIGDCKFSDVQFCLYEIQIGQIFYFILFFYTRKGKQISGIKIGPPTIFCDNNVCVGAAIFVNMVHSFRHAVDHLHAALQVTVLCPHRLCL